MKSVCLVVLSILLFAPIAQGQEAPALDINYKGGKDAFYKLFASQFRMKERDAIGVSIISWKVENGEVHDVSILNSLGKIADKELIRVLALTEDSWVSVDAPIHYHLPVKIKANEFDYFVDNKPDYLLEEIVVVTYSTNSSRQHKPDDVLVEKLNGFLTKKKYKKGISILDQLIMRNPYNQQLRESRTYALNQLGKFELACQDVQFIEEFIGSESKYKCAKKP